MACSCCAAIEDILGWKNKLTSLSSLVLVNLVYFLLFVLQKTLLSVCCYVAVVCILLGLLLRFCAASAADLPEGTSAGIGSSSSSNRSTSTSSSSSSSSSTTQSSLRTTDRFCTVETTASSVGSTTTTSASTGSTAFVTATSRPADTTASRSSFVSTLCSVPAFNAHALFTPATPSSVEAVSRQTLEDNVLYVYDQANSTVSYVRDILLWTDAGASSRVALLLWFCGYVCSWFSFAQMTFVAIWVLFTGSALRDLVFMQYIEPHLTPALDRVKEKILEVYEEVPKVAKDKLGKLADAIPKMKDVKPKTQ